MSFGITLDSGALIDLERGDKRMRVVVVQARARGVVITIPAFALIEWWRSGNSIQQQVLRSCVVESTSETLAKIASSALAEIPASVVDAGVMASAAQRGDVVYTSDMDDLTRLQARFPNVRLLRA